MAIKLAVTQCKIKYDINLGRLMLRLRDSALSADSETLFLDINLEGEICNEQTGLVTYTFTYDETLLADPETYLTKDDFDLVVINAGDDWAVERSEAEVGVSSDVDNVLSLGGDGKLYLASGTLISTDSDNLLILGSDNKLYVVTSNLLSTDANNLLVAGSDGKLYATSSDAVSSDANNLISVGGDGKLYVTSSDLISTDANNTLVSGSDTKLYAPNNTVLDLASGSCGEIGSTGSIRSAAFSGEVLQIQGAPEHTSLFSDSGVVAVTHTDISWPYGTDGIFLSISNSITNPSTCRNLKVYEHFSVPEIRADFITGSVNNVWQLFRGVNGAAVETVIGGTHKVYILASSDSAEHGADFISHGPSHVEGHTLTPGETKSFVYELQLTTNVVESYTLLYAVARSILFGSTQENAL